MTDLEITKLCAEAMGHLWSAFGNRIKLHDGDHFREVYDPLHDDAQAMALVKKFELQLDRNNAFGWTVEKSNGFWAPPFGGYSDNLNRAICECVAKMQLAKQSV